MASAIRAAAEQASLSSVTLALRWAPGGANPPMNAAADPESCTDWSTLLQCSSEEAPCTLSMPGSLGQKVPPDQRLKPCKFQAWNCSMESFKACS